MIIVAGLLASENAGARHGPFPVGVLRQRCCLALCAPRLSLASCPLFPHPI